MQSDPLRAMQSDPLCAIFRECSWRKRKTCQFLKHGRKEVRRPRRPVGVVAAWRAECAKDLGIALEVAEVVRRSLLGGGGIVALVGAPKCRIVSDVTPLSIKRDVLSVVVGPRAVTAFADLDCLGRPEPADVRAILLYKGRRLQVLNDTVADDVVHWFLERDDGRAHPMERARAIPWSDGPCTRARCTQQPYPPSGTTSFCYCTRCPRDSESRCTTCGSMDMTEP